MHRHWNIKYQQNSKQSFYTPNTSRIVQSSATLSANREVMDYNIKQWNNQIIEYFSVAILFSYMISHYLMWLSLVVKRYRCSCPRYEGI